MTFRSCIFIGVASLCLLLCGTTSVAAQEAKTEVSTQERSVAIANDALERLKRAKQENDEKKSEASETAKPDVAASSVAKKSMYFFALLLIGFSVFKKFTQKATQQSEQEYIEVVSRKALSSKTSLMIVQIDEQKILLSQSGDDVAFLTELSAKQEEVAVTYPSPVEQTAVPARKVHA